MQCKDREGRRGVHFDVSATRHIEKPWGKNFGGHHDARGVVIGARRDGGDMYNNRGEYLLSTARLRRRR